MYKVVFVRHGESVWNKLNLFTGWTDVELSDKGIEEAKNAGNLIKKNNIFDFDICFTSYLKRAIHTLNNILFVIDREWIPVVKDWHLNERHYGALQGLNKKETADKYGDNQVKLWRRSYNIKPPELNIDDKRSPQKDIKYLNIKEKLPLSESLEDTVKRVIPFWSDYIKPEILKNKKILIVAHGNSLRSLIKYFNKMSDDEIVEVNIPTGIPFVYEFDNNFNVINKYYLK